MPEPDQRVGGRGGKILVVDDEDRFRGNIARRLEMRGYTVEDVADGEEAIRAVRLGKPDVVLLDLRMPRMMGEEVLGELAQRVLALAGESLAQAFSVLVCHGGRLRHN